MLAEVPVSSIIVMIFDMLVGIFIPVFLYFFMRKKFHADRLPFFIGIVVMFLFANVLEQGAHSLILGSSAGELIKGNIWLYGIYGGMMAGLFEETGRFLAFKTILKRCRGNDGNALMYGAGHGGFEAFLIITIGMINNLVCAIMINTGTIGNVTASLSGDALTSFESSLNLLASTPAWHFILAAWERISAVIIQLSLSVIVWFAAKKGGKAVLLYPLAILLHLMVDALSVILNRYVSSTAVLELIIMLFACAVAYLAYRIWKANCTPCDQMAMNGEKAGVGSDPGYSGGTVAGSGVEIETGSDVEADAESDAESETGK